MNSKRAKQAAQQSAHPSTLLSKGPEGIDDEASSGAVKDIDGRRAHPRLYAEDTIEP